VGRFWAPPRSAATPLAGKLGRVLGVGGPKVFSSQIYFGFYIGPIVLPDICNMFPPYIVFCAIGHRHISWGNVLVTFVIFYRGESKVYLYYAPSFVSNNLYNYTSIYPDLCNLLVFVFQ